jgi:hypothetical protein
VHDADVLQIGIETALGGDVGVAPAVTDDGPLSADDTDSGHARTLLDSVAGRHYATRASARQTVCSGRLSSMESSGRVTVFQKDMPIIAALDLH